MNYNNNYRIDDPSYIRKSPVPDNRPLFSTYKASDIMPSGLPMWQDPIACAAQYRNVNSINNLTPYERQCLLAPFYGPEARFGRPSPKPPLTIAFYFNCVRKQGSYYVKKDNFISVGNLEKIRDSYYNPHLFVPSDPTDVFNVDVATFEIQPADSDYYAVIRLVAVPAVFQEICFFYHPNGSSVARKIHSKTYLDQYFPIHVRPIERKLTDAEWRNYAGITNFLMPTLSQPGLERVKSSYSSEFSGLDCLESSRDKRDKNVPKPSLLEMLAPVAVAEPLPWNVVPRFFQVQSADPPKPFVVPPFEDVNLATLAPVLINVDLTSLKAPLLSKQEVLFKPVDIVVEMPAPVIRDYIPDLLVVNPVIQLDDNLVDFDNPIESQLDFSNVSFHSYSHDMVPDPTFSCYIDSSLGNGVVSLLLSTIPSTVVTIPDDVVPNFFN